MKKERGTPGFLSLVIARFGRIWYNTSSELIFETERRIKMDELIVTINVTTYEAQVLDGNNTKVVMIPFSAEAVGEYFKGKTVENGVDTQIISADSFSLSARYMLEGVDRSGEKCRLFIENNGTSLYNCVPKIFTDSTELDFLENARLKADVECVENGVIVKIYMIS
ncbi:MAG: hypothetical protein MSH60_00235 [Ruminococcus sp.]|nr:hypothetical protein [Ruminococcus sp.]